MENETELRIKEKQNPIPYESRLVEDLEKRAAIGKMEQTLQNDRRLRGAFAFKRHTDDVDANIQALKERTRTDSLGAYLEKKTHVNLESSGWLSQQKFPTEEDLNKEMDQAAETVFGTANVSLSQRTKRGKKFKEKAKLQAKMMNQMNDFVWKRDAAMDAALLVGKNLFLGKDETIQNDTEGERDVFGRNKTAFSFFHQISGNMERNERFGTMAKDMAMFSLFREAEENWSREDYLKKAKDTALLLSNMYNKKETYREEAVKILRDLKELDLSQFEYASNEEFAQGEGARSFSRRFAALRMYSHGITLLEEVKDVPEIAEQYDFLRKKAELIREIAEDYESRALLIQSPYFALLASKDFDSIPTEELEKRRDITDDEAAKLYLTEVIHQRRRKGFGRGRKTDELLARPLEKREETTKQTVEERTVETWKTHEDRAKELFESKKTFGDSSLMKAVKENVGKVEAQLLERVNKDNYRGKFGEALLAYQKAIESCDRYLEERTSDSETAAKRRRLVIENRDQMLSDMETLASAEELVNNGQIDVDATDLPLNFILSSAAVLLLPGVETAKREEKTGSQKENLIPLSEAQGFTGLNLLFRPDTKTVRKEEEAKRYADEIGKLRRFLKELSLEKGRVSSSYTRVFGRQLLVTKDASGGVTLRTGDQRVSLKESLSDLIHLLDTKMIEEQAILNPEDIKDVIWDQDITIEFLLNDDEEKSVKHILRDMGDVQRTSKNLARFLELKTGKSTVFFSNLEPAYLRWIALDIVRGVDMEVVIKQLERVSAAVNREERTINTRETLQLIKEAEKKKEEIDEKIVYRTKMEQEERKGWQPEEQETIHFLSDLFFSRETWKADESVNDPGERLRLMLDSHLDVFTRFVMDTKDVKKIGLLPTVIGKLPTDVGKVMTPVLFLVNNLILEAGKLAGTTADEKQLKARLKELIDQKNEGLMNLLKSTDGILGNVVEQIMGQIQDQINTHADHLFGNEENTAENEDGVEIITPEAIREAAERKKEAKKPKTKEDIVKEGEEKLKSMMEDSIKGNSGQGLFIKLIFKDYFKRSSMMDKRSMLASAIRNAAVKEEQILVPEEAGEEERLLAQKINEDIEKQEQGDFLGGILKGAGPLFQKILQGLPTDGVEEHIRAALEDMKSKLAPIPEEIVKAQLFGMVERSGGRITRIEVEKALGAASVGQTFLCKMYGPDLPEEGRDVVVKLLKPDVRNRMMREKQILLDCARRTDTSGGMEATFLGQLSRIEEELDLTIEARNVNLGKIYDKSVIEGQDSDGVRSMKLETLVDPTVNAMMLEMAPGITVDRYKKELIQKREEREKEFERRPEEIADIKKLKAPTEPKCKRNGKDLTFRQLRKLLADVSAKIISKEELTNLEPDLEELQRQMTEYNRELGIYNVEATNLPGEAQRNYHLRLLELRKDILKDLTQLEKREAFLAKLAKKWVTEGIFGEGFYHGDLHAGNIMISDEGATIIDFGNATKLTEAQQKEVTRMVAAAAAGDWGTYQEGLHALINPEFEGVYQEKKKALSEELKKIFTLADGKSAGLRIAASLLKAQELGIEVPSSIQNFSQCQLRLQNTIDDMIKEINALRGDLGKLDDLLKNSDQGLNNNDILSNFLVMVSEGRDREESPETTAKRSHLDLTRCYRKICYEDPELYRDAIKKGDFYRWRLEEMEKKDGKEMALDKARKEIKAGLEKIREKLEKTKEELKKDPEYQNAEEIMKMMLRKKEMAALVSELDSSLKSSFGQLKEVACTDALSRLLTKTLESYIENQDPAKIDAFRDSLDSYLAQRIELAKPVLKAYHETEKVLKDKKKKEEEKDQAIVSFLGQYKKLGFIYAQTSKGSFESMEMFRINLRDSSVDEMHTGYARHEIEEMAKLDPELGARLKELFAEYLEKEKAEPEKFLDRLPLVDQMTELMFEITVKVIKPVYEATKESMGIPVHDFLDSMGESIGENFYTSLGRLGIFTALKYRYTTDMGI
ncbi:MAG: phosphotransferase [Lachnospiraceae bacterium]|nr:phosphotransferase [Lachnospiraceae bacterium]